jgi:hypothetical protein
MAFTLADNILRRICEINSFPVPSQGLIFFGLRGCLPANPDDQTFRTEHVLDVAAFDHVHPRCTLGQWMPEGGTLAVFPGSTVPHRKYVKSSLEKDGKGTNQMMTGFYSNYRKGVHKAAHRPHMTPFGRPKATRFVEPRTTSILTTTIASSS